MDRRLPAIPVVLVILALSSPAVLAADLEGFHKTWAEAQKAAREQNKPIYLHFTTDWCTWCRKMEKDTYGNAAAKAAMGSFVTASLDCTSPRGQEPAGQAAINLALMEKFAGQGYPFLVMTTPDGAVLNVLSGYLPPAEFTKELSKGLGQYNELARMEQLTAGPKGKDLDTQIQAMTFYAKVKLWSKAAASAEKVRTLDPKDSRGQAAEATFLLIKGAEAEELANAQPNPARQVKMDLLLDDVRKYDPRNEKGVLEEVLATEAFKSLVQARRLQQAEQRKALAAKGLSLLNELIGKAVHLKDGQMVWYFIGAAYGLLEQSDKALPAFEKSLALAPDSQAASRIKAAIAQMKSGGK